MGANNNEYMLCNGRILPVSVPCISPLDRGYLLGDGLFESMRSYKRSIPLWELHMERLREGMSLLGFPDLGEGVDHIRDGAEKLIEMNALPDAYIRLTVSRGESQQGILPAWGEGEPNWLLLVRQIPAGLEKIRREGVRAVISSIRKNSSSPVARIKSTNYLDMILAKREAFIRGAAEAILLDERGMLAEASTANLFWVNGETLYTPSCTLPILPGITRQQVLWIANGLGIQLLEGVYGAKTVMECEEAFLTNSLQEITPLVSIDGHRIGDGRPGPVTRRLQDAYKEAIEL